MDFYLKLIMTKEISVIAKSSLILIFYWRKLMV